MFELPLFSFENGDMLPMRSIDMFFAFLCEISEDYEIKLEDILLFRLEISFLRLSIRFISSYDSKSIDSFSKIDTLP
jgi:hypothetical protein